MTTTVVLTVGAIPSVMISLGAIQYELSVVDTFGTHSVDRQYKPCESYTDRVLLIAKQLNIRRMSVYRSLQG